MRIIEASIAYAIPSFYICHIFFFQLNVPGSYILHS